MSDEFYWLNTGNMVEFNGPFLTIDEAKQNCVKAYQSIGDLAGSIVITKLVLSARVTTDFKWRKINRSRGY